MADWRDDCKTEIIWPETGTSHRPGGQYVGGGPNMIRVTHTPTNTVAQFGEHRSQHKNRDIAMGRLIQQIRDAQAQQTQNALSSQRRSLVGSGDRSEKIRTYNWPQNRVTDHRLEGDNKNFNLDKVIEGDLEGVIEALLIADNAERMKGEAQED